MTDFDSLREDIAQVADALLGYARAVDRFNAAQAEQVGKLWADNAELRDELHAVANRVEALTRAVSIRPGSDFVRRADDFSAVEE